MSGFLRSMAGLAVACSCQANAGDFYGSAGFQQNTIKISDSSFSVYGATARVGAWMLPGIGFEVAATIPATDERQSDVIVGMDSLVSAGIRLESPSSLNRRTATYVLGGFATARISSMTGDSTRTSNNYNGGFVGVGLLHTINLKSHLTFDYVYYKVDDSIAIPSLRFGFRQLF